jgi:hypothetical protein
VTNPRASVLLFPIALPLAIISDKLFAKSDEGIFLLAHAKKL